MLKVVIADDEVHVCRLIQALVDWEEMGMEVVGVASNGIEAIALVERLLPDLLITDIRMPGCNGLELIEHVKTANPNLEVIIISGYAHFPYAQTAMRYGVGNYLLKPINKVELVQTLQKLCSKIRERLESESGLERLIQKEQNAIQRMKDNLLWDLLNNKIPDVSVSVLQEEYDFQVNEGVFQTFCIKMDYEKEKVNESALAVVHEKAKDIIEANLAGLCNEHVFIMDQYWGYGILNFDGKRQDDIRRVIRSCMNQLVVQKGILGPIEFTFAIDGVLKEISGIGGSLRQCREIMKERIVLGTERIIEGVPKERALKGKNLLDGYSRIITNAIETLDQEEASKACKFLKNTVMDLKNIRGYEVLELVTQAGSLFLLQVEVENQKELIEEYTEKCKQISSINGLFEQLEKMHSTILDILQVAHDNDVLRPIRMAKKYIQNHYQEQITLEEVSDVVGLSTSYFSALFKKETGEGFAKYLIFIRVEAAKILLRESNMAVAAICKEVGYNDVKHFTQTFEKSTGLKPSAYRKLYG